MEENYCLSSDLLKDTKFLQWQLMPSEELNSYWNNLIETNPHLTDKINEASSFLKNNGLNKKYLNEDEKNKLLNDIHRTIEKKQNRKKAYRLIQYSAACIAVTVVIIALTTPFFKETRIVTKNNQKELIVGNLLNSEDIQLITGNESTVFTTDIEMKIDEKGTATILQDDMKTEKKLDITKNALNKLVVPYGKRTQLNLSDGSKIWLNSGSELEFPTKFDGKDRNIYLLAGEMYIEVASDNKRSFYVHTSNFNIKVHGTKFNISTYTDSPQSVVLVEGSVSLQSENKNDFFLAPNEKAIYSDGKMTKQKVDVTQFISWKNGYFTLDKTPMNEVLKQIERYYNLSFNYEQDVNLQKRTCSGKIFLSENLDNVMTTVGLLSSTSYRKENNKIYIVNEPN